MRIRRIAERLGRTAVRCLRHTTTAPIRIPRHSGSHHPQDHPTLTRQPAALKQRTPSARSRERIAVIFDALTSDIVEGRFQRCPFAKAAVEAPTNLAAMTVVREHHDTLVGHLTAITGDTRSAETIAMLYDGAIIAAKATGEASPVAHARDAAIDLVA